MIIMIILLFIIGRMLSHRRETENRQANVEVDNVNLHTVEEGIVVDSHHSLENVPHDNVDEAIVVDLHDVSDNVPHANVDDAIVVDLHDNE